MEILYISIFLILLFSACQSSTKQSNFTNIVFVDSLSVKSTELNMHEIKKIKHIDTLSLEDVLFNDIKLFTSYSKLKGETDSVVFKLWECGNPFQWMDEKADNDSICHIYQDGKEYITNKNSLLLFSSMLNQNRFTIVSRNITFTDTTSIENFIRLFPNAYFDLPKTSDGMIKIGIAFNTNMPDDSWIFYFRDGYLYKFELYWNIC